MDGVTMLSLCYRVEGRLTLKLSWVAKTAPRMKGIEGSFSPTPPFPGKN